ncbi:MAG TPA: PEP/pyruvate-binding domain-containing protein [Fimbriimonas sp.]|nr:PEP/pyruvate-binding domain-containing protein [Fimbriimonas sp.]
MSSPFVVDLSEVRLADRCLVGPKNAWLGELAHHKEDLGIHVPVGFATTLSAYQQFLSNRDLVCLLSQELCNLPESGVGVRLVSRRARNLVVAHALSTDLKASVVRAYEHLRQEVGSEPELAVRSSTIVPGRTGDTPKGLNTSFLNIRGKAEMFAAVHHCFASAFTDRALLYYLRNAIDPLSVSISVAVQPMVRSDLAAAGAMWTLNGGTDGVESVDISGSYGIGESVMQGVTKTDEWTVKDGKIISRRLGPKELKLVYEANAGGTRLLDVAAADREQFCISDADVLQLASSARRVAQTFPTTCTHPKSMELEWAKDGLTGDLYILQATLAPCSEAPPV